MADLLAIDRPDQDNSMASWRLRKAGLSIPQHNGDYLHENLHSFQSYAEEQELADTTAKASNQPRIRLLYSDERVRDRICANAQRLLRTVIEDPKAISTSAQIAHKALRYRKVLHRLDEIDPGDPTFDVSTFFGVEWCKDNWGETDKDIPA